MAKLSIRAGFSIEGDENGVRHVEPPTMSVEYTPDPPALAAPTKPFASATAWIDEKYAADAKQIGVSCNPIRRKLYLIADKERRIIDCPTQLETRLLKDILHDYIAALPAR